MTAKKSHQTRHRPKRKHHKRKGKRKGKRKSYQLLLAAVLPAIAIVSALVYYNSKPKRKFSGKKKGQKPAPPQVTEDDSEMGKNKNVDKVNTFLNNGGKLSHAEAEVIRSIEQLLADKKAKELAALIKRPSMIFAEDKIIKMKEAFIELFLEKFEKFSTQQIKDNKLEGEKNQIFAPIPAKKEGVEVREHMKKIFETSLNGAFDLRSTMAELKNFPEGKDILPNCIKELGAPSQIRYNQESLKGLVNLLLDSEKEITYAVITTQGSATFSVACYTVKKLSIVLDTHRSCTYLASGKQGLYAILKNIQIELHLDRGIAQSNVGHFQENGGKAFGDEKEEKNELFNELFKSATKKKIGDELKPFELAIYNKGILYPNKVIFLGLKEEANQNAREALPLCGLYATYGIDTIMEKKSFLDRAKLFKTEEGRRKISSYQEEVMESVDKERLPLILGKRGEFFVQSITLEKFREEMESAFVLHNVAQLRNSIYSDKTEWSGYMWNQRKNQPQSFSKLEIFSEIEMQEPKVFRNMSREEAEELEIKHMYGDGAGVGMGVEAPEEGRSSICTNVG